MYVFAPEGAFIITHIITAFYRVSRLRSCFKATPQVRMDLLLESCPGEKNKKKTKNMDMPCKEAKWKYYAFFLYHRGINLSVGPCNQAAPAPKEVDARTYQLLWCEMWKCDERQRKHRLYS